MTQAQQANIFEQASKQKLRFDTPQGKITTEDLWDLPLQHSTKANLDQIAIGLDAQIKANTPVVSFVSKGNANANAPLELGLAVVRHIIGIKIAERDAATQAQARAANAQRAMAILADRQNQEMANMTTEQLQAIANGSSPEEVAAMAPAVTPVTPQ